VLDKISFAEPLSAGAFGIDLSVGIGEIIADLVVESQVPCHVKQMMERLSPSRE
jgi:hypothetical protein